LKAIKPKFHIFFDRRQLLSLFAVALFIYGAAKDFRSGEGLGLFWIPFCLLNLLFLAIAVRLPCLYVMTDRGIRIFFAFGFLRSFIPWETVRKLKLHMVVGRKQIPYFFDVIRIDGKADGPHFWFMDNEMVRTHRARRLLERYTGIPVEGYALRSFRQMKKDRRDRQALAERRAARQARVERRRETEKMNKHRPQ
jgi:hypothetical protein